MAEKQEQTNQTSEEKQESKSASTGIMPWIVLVVLIVIFAGSGILLGRIFAKPSPVIQMPVSANSVKVDVFEPLVDKDGNPEKSWYYDLEPVVANLDEPGVTRYIRVALTFEMSGELEQKSMTEMLDGKKPVLTNWLTIYLSSLSLDNIRGDKNLRRIQSQILRQINEKLFKDSKPMIKNVLFKEFAIQ